MNRLRKYFFSLSLLGIVILAFILRCYRFDQPIADWHSWRQVDTAAVARNFVDLGFDPLRPRYDDLSNIQSGKDNPQGYRMVEFPIYQSLAYAGYLLVPNLGIEAWLRFISIVASVLTIFLLGWLVKQIHTSLSGLSAALLLAVTPYAIFYGRSMLPEPLMVFLALASVATTWLATNQKTAIKTILAFALAAILASLALLVKPYAIFVLLPAGWLYLRWLVSTKQLPMLPRLLLTIGLGLVALIPFGLWRNWITQFPEGIPVSSWLFNEGNLRFKGAWFRWLFAERIAKMFLGYWGIALLAIGLLVKIKQGKGVVAWFIVGSIAYLVIFARGNVQHDYYQQLILPTIMILAGLGLDHVLRGKGVLDNLKRIVLAGVIVLFGIGFAWYEIRGFFWINHPEIVAAGNAAHQLLPANAKVIAPYNGDTTFLYQTKRQGWPIGFEIEKKIQQGATHYVTVKPSDEDGETKDLVARYTVLVRNEQFAIIDLTKPTNEVLPQP